MNVRILRRAEADLLAIYRFVMVENPIAARSLTQRIRERCTALGQLPEQGRPT